MITVLYYNENIILEKRKVALYELFRSLYNKITINDNKIYLDKMTIKDEKFQTYKRKYNVDEKRAIAWARSHS